MFGDEVYLPRAIGRSDGSEADRNDHCSFQLDVNQMGQKQIGMTIMVDELDVKSSRCSFWGGCYHVYIYICGAIVKYGMNPRL
jgi:hypothetical protein